MFTSGYLLAWAAAGAVAFAARAAVDAMAPGALQWDRAGRWVAGATLVLAAVYQLTPLKDVCLGKCRSPLGALLGSWRDGPSGSIRMGIKNGLWCVGCCWALMASLFALGIMSITWMAVVAALIALEKLAPPAPRRHLRDCGCPSRPRGASARQPPAPSPGSPPHTAPIWRCQPAPDPAVQVLPCQR